MYDKFPPGSQKFQDIGPAPAGPIVFAVHFKSTCPKIMMLT